jgi:hypothetical protein
MTAVSKKLVSRSMMSFVAAAMLLTGTALVSTRAQAADIIPSLGMTKPVDGSDRIRTSYGLAVRAPMAPILDAEVGVAYRQDEVSNGSIERTQWPITGSLWLKPTPMLYAGGGVGWYNTTLKFPGTTNDSQTSQDFGVHLGGGLSIPMVPNTASLDLNGRYVYLGDQTSDLPPQNFKADFWTTSLGVAFHF